MRRRLSMETKQKKMGRPRKGKQVSTTYGFREEPAKMEILIQDFGSVSKAINKLIENYLKKKNN